MNYYYQKKNDYRQVQIKTATPEKLLIMCYDGILKFLRTSKLLISKNQKEKSDIYILKASNVILELIATLRHDESPEFASALKSLYIYILDRLRESIRTGNEDGIDYAINVITQIKQTWEEAIGTTPENMSLEEVKSA
ncbi:MAG: flagellar export chaperone FliS [Firmicutes bacterium]|nr:flagellar export chaperone FliS [Bacillota bacterium]